MLIQELIGKYSIPNDAVRLINQEEIAPGFRRQECRLRHRPDFLRVPERD
jgi:hypothetical protein